MSNLGGLMLAQNDPGAQEELQKAAVLNQNFSRMIQKALATIPVDPKDNDNSRD